MLSVSPLQYSRAVLVNKRLVVWLQLINVGQISGLGVQVKFAVQRIEDVTAASRIMWIWERKTLTWTLGPRAAYAGLCHCTDACSLHGSARGRTNGSESCTAPEEREKEQIHKTESLSSAGIVRKWSLHLFCSTVVTLLSCHLWVKYQLISPQKQPDNHLM